MSGKPNTKKARIENKTHIVIVVPLPLNAHPPICAEKTPPDCGVQPAT
jgi:hypothetical protein